MAIVRVPKVNNYTIMSNFHLRDKRLDFKAVGLMSWMLSNPDDWDYSIAGIAATRKEGKSAIETAVKALESCGYLERILVRKKNGKFDGYDYILHEEPLTENPSTENPSTEKPMTENQQQLNTIRTNNYSNKVSKKESKKTFNDIISQNYKNEEIKSILGEFIQMRFRINKPITNTSLKYLLDKLEKLSSNDEETIDIVKQSIVNSWADFYPVKKDTKQSNKPTEKKKKVNQFNNFRQREYTAKEMSDLELRLLKQ